MKKLKLTPMTQESNSRTIQQDPPEGAVELLLEALLFAAEEAEAQGLQIGIGRIGRITSEYNPKQLIEDLTTILHTERGERS